MLAIYKKELRSYFHSVIGWLFLAILLFFVGLYFTVYNMKGGSPYLSYTLSGVVFIFILIIPILTMKILSEEKKQKTDQLLFTAPLTIWKIILGKYFALITILFIAIVIISIYPLILSIYGTIPFGENYLSLLGFFLFGAACMSLGVFISSLTESQVISAVLTFAALLIGVLISGISSIISITGNTFTKLLSIFDITMPLENLLNGIVDISAILYYLSMIFLFLFFTSQIIQKRRWSVATQGIKKGVLSIGMTIVVIAFIIGANVGIGLLPGTTKTIDITQEKLYSITDTTKEVLDGLEEDITIYVLCNPEDADTTIKTMLSRYTSYSSRISIQYKNQEEFPSFSSTYTSDTLVDNSLIVVGENRSTTISYSDCYAWEYIYDETYGYVEDVTGYDGEGQITSAISYVVNDNLPTVYVIGGHEEYDLSEALLKSISKENIEIETINLINFTSIPEDAAGIIIAGPIIDYTNDEIIKVNDYLDQGGKGIFLVAASTSDMSNFESMLENYGVTIVEGVVFEGDTNYYNQLPYYLLPEIIYNTLTASIYDNNRYILLPQSRGIIINDDLSDDITITPLLTTSSSSYSKINVTTMETMEKEEGDIAGPFDLGLSIERTRGDTITNLIVFGSEYLIDETMDNTVSGANSSLFINCLSSIVEHKSSISVPVKSYQLSYIIMSEQIIIVMSSVITGMIPVILLVLGFIIWFRRRKL